ncbi:beta-ketoacyl synthase chain length factor [Flocculibacter collagenilyticus]|uniref:beta-ketoacyl synthase chain length factor n=1 Tax=Flocculibacter collagenilyticus TaxID=2744479 RepID=UPI0018F41B27|nr:beta-ketoacyl synthase chain length factor [Flocculibacter collagenilyticus]
MEICFSIENLVYLRADKLNQEQGCGTDTTQFDKNTLPKLDWVAPMQRRRLSSFAKMALFCAHKSVMDEDANKTLDTIFSSRHGDLHKTSAILDDIANELSPSPTAFSLSVHNAVAGLFTILTNNTNASSTISAGSNSFFMAIVDAYARLKANNINEILFVHCDQVLPEVYTDYADELQIDHAIAFKMRLSQHCDASIKLEKLTGKFNESVALPEPDNGNSLPQSLQFLNWLEAEQGELEIHTHKTTWKLSK